MFGITELVDKMSDNLIITTSSVSAGTVSEIVSVPHELAIFVLVSTGIIMRLILERAWKRHERRAQHKRDKLAARRARLHPAKTRHEYGQV